MLALNFTPFPNLSTERLVLRQLTIEDTEKIFLLRSDTSVNKYVGRPNTITIEEARQFINKITELVSRNESVYWVISLKNTPELIGTICYWNITKENDTAEIGYELFPSFQGKGIMQEAIAKVISYGFDTMQLRTITAFPSEDNERSIHLLKKFDFKRDGKLEEETRDELNNLVIYSLSKK